MQWKVWKLRKEHNKTQEEMAEILKIHFTTYSSKERGITVFTAEEYHILSQFFDVKIDDIFLSKNCINNAKTESEVN